MNELRNVLIGTAPTSVCDDAEPLCQRLQRANESGNIKEMGSPVRVYTLDFADSPVSIQYDCPFQDECDTVNQKSGLLKVCTLVLNQVIDEKRGGFVPNAYELPPVAEDIFACSALQTMQQLPNNSAVATGQQG